MQIELVGQRSGVNAAAELRNWDDPTRIYGWSCGRGCLVTVEFLINRFAWEGGRTEVYQFGVPTPSAGGDR